ncbi:MAG: T9SS type A sorting domain-containing protein [Ignavibacteriaceae bacterium]
MVVDSMTQYAAQSSGFYKLKSNYFVPVELVSFTAKTSDYEIILQWITSTELNNTGFEIQRSYNNQNFEKIGFVSGYGTTTQPKLYTFKIDQYKSGIQYYRLKQINLAAPSKLSLAQNYPNPFNPATKIKYTIATSSFLRKEKVRLIVYDVLGNKVATLVDEYEPSGSYEAELDASKYNLVSGVYFYQLNAGDFNEMKKMILLR